MDEQKYIDDSQRFICGRVRARGAGEENIIVLQRHGQCAHSCVYVCVCILSIDSKNTNKAHLSK